MQSVGFRRPFELSSVINLHVHAHSVQERFVERDLYGEPAHFGSSERVDIDLICAGRQVIIIGEIELSMRNDEFAAFFEVEQRVAQDTAGSKTRHKGLIGFQEYPLDVVVFFSSLDRLYDVVQPVCLFLLNAQRGYFEVIRVFRNDLVEFEPQHGIGV